MLYVYKGEMWRLLEMYIGEGVPYVHGVYLPPIDHPTMAPTLPEMAQKGQFWAQNSVAVQNSKELFEL